MAVRTCFEASGPVVPSHPLRSSRPSPIGDALNLSKTFLINGSINKKIVSLMALGAPWVTQWFWLNDWMLWKMTPRTHQALSFSGPQKGNGPSD